MQDFLVDAFPWIKSLHIISVIAWMAGLFYLPRLFVYHCEAETGSKQSETFKIMERRLLRVIMNPAMIGVYIFGLLLAGTPGVVVWASGWIWVKLAAVGGMSYLHHLYGRWRKDFAADINTRPQKTYRLANEGPTVLMIVIVVMVVAKPF